MSWLEKDVDSNTTLNADAERSKILDQVRDENLPTMVKESNTGKKKLDPVQFQPVKSPGNYEAEFTIKDGNLLFHFWPSGYHLAERRGVAAPKFPNGFDDALSKSMGDVFESKRVKIGHDSDMGAMFVIAIGWGENQFAKELAIEACKKLHASLGGDA